jgi:hypothetical protein
VAPTSAGGGQTIYNTPSRWNTAAGPDTMSGTCSGAITPPYGLVLITPFNGGETLNWHNTVPEDYLFLRISDDMYQYTGPSGVGAGAVTMVLTFVSNTSLQMVRSFVPAAEPGCTHTHTYTGTFEFFQP